MSENLQDEIQISQQPGSLTLQGPIFEEQKHLDEPDWFINQIGPKKILLERKQANQSAALRDLASCSTNLFADFLYGLIERVWSGAVIIHTDIGVKQIVLEDGKICFARTNIMDERLGETLYRSRMITLDQMIDAAVKVDRNRKFGQVLLRSNIIKPIQLWAALKMQVEEIIRAVFMLERVYFEILEGKGFSSSQVVFSKSSKDIIQDAYFYGLMFREFVKTTDLDSEIKVKHPERLLQFYPKGTYEGDFINLIIENPKVKDLLEHSKLANLYTYANLMHLVQRGLCILVSGSSKSNLPEVRGIDSLKSRIDAYTFILKESVAAFAKINQQLPIDQLHAFILQLNPAGYLTINLSEAGELTQNTLRNIFSQCGGHPLRIKHFESILEGLTHFLLQLVGDYIGFDFKTTLTKNYKSLVQ